MEYCPTLSHVVTWEVGRVADLVSYAQVNEIVSKGHQRANAILRCFVSRDNTLLVRAFVTYVYPFYVLEFNSVIYDHRTYS